jgi:PST family polysaccharide transporter
MFPIYAMLQGNLPALRRVYLQNLQRVALFSLPLSVAFVVAAHPIVLALLGPKWEGATTALQILAAFGLLKSFAGPSGEVFRGIGKPHFGLAIAAGQIPLVVPLLIALTQSGRITGTAIAMLIGMGTIAPISLALTSRAIDLPVRQMVYAVAPSAVCAAIAGAVLAVVAGATHSLTPALSLVVLVITGGFTYIVSTALIARAAVTSMWSALRPARDHPERLQSTG